MSNSEQRITRRWRVNGELREVSFEPLARLLDVLRDELDLISLKEGCGEGECGACSLILDPSPLQPGSAGDPQPGEVRLACLTAAAQLEDGATLLTAEGLGSEPIGRALAEELGEGGGVQCGYCTPGVMIGSYALLRDLPSPSETEVRQRLAGHLCRCTGYTRIVEAVHRAAQRGVEVPRSQETAARKVQPPEGGR